MVRGDSGVQAQQLRPSTPTHTVSHSLLVTHSLNSLTYSLSAPTNQSIHSTLAVTVTHSLSLTHCFVRSLTNFELRTSTVGGRRFDDVDVDCFDVVCRLSFVVVVVGSRRLGVKGCGVLCSCSRRLSLSLARSLCARVDRCVALKVQRCVALCCVACCASSFVRCVLCHDYCTTRQRWCEFRNELLCVCRSRAWRPNT